MPDGHPPASVIRNASLPAEQRLTTTDGRRMWTVRCGRLAAAALGVVIAVGCSYVGPIAPASSVIESAAPSLVSLGSPNPTPSRPAPAATSEPTPSPSPTMPAVPPPDPTPQPTPCCVTPSPPPSQVPGLAASDLFWNRWVDSCFFGVYPLPSSLAEIVRDADLIVRGSIADLYVGEHWRGGPDEPSYPLAYVRVEIDEILKGAPVSRESGSVEVQLGDSPEDLNQLRKRLPTHDHLWFLTYEGIEGRSEWNQSEIAPYAYYAPTEVATVFRDVGGVVRVLRPDWIAESYGSDQFPLALDGSDFDKLIDRVHQLVHGSSRALQGYARWSLSYERDPNRFAAC
jgi:hypothetical protein